MVFVSVILAQRLFEVIILQGGTLVLFGAFFDQNLLFTKIFYACQETIAPSIES